MFGIGPWELVVVLVVVLVIFGPGRLPELGKGLGEGIKNFKKAYRDSKAIDVTGPSSSAGNGQSAAGEKIEASGKDKP